MEIYIVTELNILASGEKEIYVTPFEFIADAEKEKERLTEEHIDEGYKMCIRDSNKACLLNQPLFPF